MINRWIRTVLYNLKRLYGVNITVVYFSRSTDLSGSITDTPTAYNIKAIVLPVNEVETFMRQHLQNTPNFGDIQLYDTVVLISQKDLSVQINTDSYYLVIKNKRFEILKIEDYYDGAAWVVKAKAVKGSEANNVHVISLVDYVSFTGEVQ